jgi:hypothetical protein
LASDFLGRTLVVSSVSNEKYTGELHVELLGCQLKLFDPFKAILSCEDEAETQT